MHTHFKKGTRVLIVCKDDSEIIGKFKDRKSQYVILEDERVHIQNIKTIGIYKDRTPDIDKSDNGND